MAKKLKPIHPGEILREEFMKPLGLSMNRMGLDLRVPVTRIADIVNERRGITADTALRFARYFKNSAAFWMNLQTRCDLEVAEDEISGKVERDVRHSNPRLFDDRNSSGEQIGHGSKDPPPLHKSARVGHPAEQIPRPSHNERRPPIIRIQGLCHP